MFFIASALVLTTAGVFAGKAKFSASGSLYAYNTTLGYVNVSPSTTFGGLNTVSGSALQSQITDYKGFTYSLYISPSVGTYNQVTSTISW
jgi:hypothetical protein